MDVIGRYRLRDKIGAGAFATVWRGYDDDLDVDVAVKVLADNWASRADVREHLDGDVDVQVVVVPAPDGGERARADLVP